MIQCMKYGWQQDSLEYKKLKIVNKKNHRGDKGLDGETKQKERYQ